jgi:alpha-N-arabinofuranosidase
MSRNTLIGAWLALFLLAHGICGEELSLTLHPERVLNQVDEKVYGHFLEHIYHSVNGGLWGELIWNRSFEENDAGQWEVGDGCVVQKSLAANQRLTFGNPDWEDYEFTLEALKTGGNEGFLVLFRAKSEKDFYWCNLGGWGNERYSLERGRSGESRWHAVGPRVDGGIESGRWYRIKVRCEGLHFSVWLDDRLLIDFTDLEGHRSGMVGVGTWATQAKFRHLEVTSLDGKVLYEGLPEKLTRPSVARHWEAFGSGEVFLQTDRPLNSRFCQQLVARGGESGLQQRGLCLRRGEPYVGSVWARGSAPDGLVVRLQDGTTTLAEARLPATTDRWQQYPFSFPAKADAPDATIQMVAAGQSDVWIDQLSLMPESWKHSGGFRPDLLDAIGELRPPLIRWPGGCFASAYRWKDGIGPQHERGVYPRPIWDDLDVNSFGTDEFVAMCRRVNAQPLIVVNIGTKRWTGEVEREAFLQEVCDWIEYCNGPPDSKCGKIRAANGHPQPYHVRYWEIDNETWHMGAEAYAEAVCEFAPAMRKADPSVKLAACGSAGYGDGDRGLAWNQTIIDRCAELVDYLSIHHYENPSRFEQGPRAYEAFFRKTAELIAGSKNPKLKIYVSEWNAQSTDWRTGLYCGGLLNAFERCGDVLEMGGPALFLRHVSATAWDNAFVNFDNRTWFPAPNYVVMKLWREHYQPLRIELSGDPGPLNAVATKSEDGRSLCLKAVNPSKGAVSVSLEIPGGFAAGETAMQLVAPGTLDARNTLEAPDAVSAKPSRAAIDGHAVRFEMPPLSAAVVTIAGSP